MSHTNDEVKQKGRAKTSGFPKYTQKIWAEFSEKKIFFFKIYIFHDLKIYFNVNKSPNSKEKLVFFCLVFLNTHVCEDKAEVSLFICGFYKVAALSDPGIFTSSQP